MNEQFWWYLARSSGLVAWALLAASLIWGVLLATKLLAPDVRPAWTLDLHRWLGGLTIVMTGVHLAALIADSYVTFTLADVLVPFASDYQRVGVALGVLGLWLAVAVQVSSLMLRRIPTRLWRRVHLASYALVVVVSVHAVVVGTDALRGYYAGVTVALVLAPLAAVAERLRHARNGRSPRPATARGATVRAD